MNSDSLHLPVYRSINADKQNASECKFPTDRSQDTMRMK